MLSPSYLQHYPELLQQVELQAIVAVGNAARMPLAESMADDNELIRAYARLALELIDEAQRTTVKAALPIGFRGTIVLKSGEFVHGEVVARKEGFRVARSEEGVTVKLDAGGEQSFLFEDVERVESDEPFAKDVGPLQARIALPHTEVGYGVQITVQLHLTNHSTDSLMVADADLYAHTLTGASTLDLLIQDAAGRSVERAGIGVDDSGPAYGRLDPGETRTSVHPLYPQFVRGYPDDLKQYHEGRVKPLGHWSYWLNSHSPDTPGWMSEFLPPGRYTLQLKYHVPEKARWPGSSSSVWHGELLSNTLALTVREKSEAAPADSSTGNLGGAEGNKETVGTAQNALDPLVQTIHSVTPDTIRIRNLEVSTGGSVVVISGTTAAAEEEGKQQFVEYLKILSQLPGFFGDIEVESLIPSRGADGYALLFTVILYREPQ